MNPKLEENFKRVQGNIEAACERADRSPEEITLVTVTKTVGIEVIRELVDAGVRHLGESRVQQLTERAEAVGDYLASRPAASVGASDQGPIWHMVGHLQRNKVKAVLPHVQMIHSVDTLRLAEEIDERARKMNRSMDVLLEVNVGLEEQKHGAAVGAATHLGEQIETMPHLRLVGLMCMAPLTEDEQKIRYCFSRLQELYQEMHGEVVRAAHFRHLSMGMSNDYEIAIEYGATILRIGTVLFEGVQH